MGSSSSSDSAASSSSSSAASPGAPTKITARPLATMHAADPHSSQSCHDLLRKCEMFQKLPEDRLDILAKHMEYRVFEKNDVMLRQGHKSDRFFLLESGDVRRKKIDPSTGKAHNIEYAIKANSINSMKVISGDPVVRTCLFGMNGSKNG
jgi:hypothetical protein